MISFQFKYQFVVMFWYALIFWIVVICEIAMNCCREAATEDDNWFLRKWNFSMRCKWLCQAWTRYIWKMSSMSRHLFWPVDTNEGLVALSATSLGRRTIWQLGPPKSNLPWYVTTSFRGKVRWQDKKYLSKEYHRFYRCYKMLQKTRHRPHSKKLAAEIKTIVLNIKYVSVTQTFIYNRYRMSVVI